MHQMRTEECTHCDDLIRKLLKYLQDTNIKDLMTSILTSAKLSKSAAYLYMKHCALGIKAGHT